MKKFFFSTKQHFSDIGLLILRVAAGAMMMTHGYAKLDNFSTLKDVFGDPIGLGPFVSLLLTIFAEFICSILVMVGFATRFALIPLIITMVVAVFVVHGGDPFAKKELGLIYLSMYGTLMLLGPGKLSIDNMIK
ncbi:DoxX family protein [Penaeicola halotolerans]|uniref:DoxX family protein n=1 Tax=Penaeicola halotolerans TaxID=2793196 RepID=UPI001CF91BCF|nr:DoxX family protein [Penaeicola halotolerans]